MHFTILKPFLSARFVRGELGNVKEEGGLLPGFSFALKARVNNLEVAPLKTCREALKIFNDLEQRRNTFSTSFVLFS